MLTDAILLQRNLDSPLRRLRWTLPMSLLIWALALWSLTYIMGKPIHRQAEQPPIDAQFIELPEPIIRPEPPPPTEPEQKVVKTPVQTKEAATTYKSPAAPVEPTPIPPQALDTPVAEPAPIVPQVVEAPVAPPEPKAPPPVEMPVVQKKQEATAPSSAPAVESSVTGRGFGTSNTIMSSGARAITRPMPEIPDDLREETFDAVALARFHITADSNVTVELAKPTRNLRLNRILLDALKRWQFSPAIRDGKPIASTEEIVIKINVD